MSYCSSGCSGLQPNRPYAACYRSPRCNLLSPNWKYDPHLQYFCQKFGQYAPQACEEVVNPCQSIHQPLQSLDYFSLPPMYRKGGYQTKFRCQSKDYVKQNSCGSCRSPSAMMDSCPGIPQLARGFRPNPKLYGDAVCGLCVSTRESEAQARDSCAQGQGDQDEGIGQENDGLPFVVYPLWTTDSAPKKEPQRNHHSIAKGVTRCIHPSSFRSLDTVTKLEHGNFFTMKSPEELALYQSTLAVDNRRSPLCIPGKEPTDELDLSKPLYVTAKMLSNRRRGKAGLGDTVSVYIPGPITIG